MNSDTPKRPVGRPRVPAHLKVKPFSTTLRQRDIGRVRQVAHMENLTPAKWVRLLVEKRLDEVAPLPEVEEAEADDLGEL